MGQAGQACGSFRQWEGRWSGGGTVLASAGEAYWFATALILARGKYH